MINYQVALQKGAIAKATAEGVISRNEVYYPQIVGVNNMDLFQLVDAILNLGSTAFTRGEWTGVISDLGSAVAQQLINGYKVEIPGLGVFEPTLKTTQSNVKDQSKINSSYFTCGAKFTPDSRFDQVLAGVEWKKKASSAVGGVGSASYALVFKKQTNNANLKFECSKAEVLNHVNVSAITALINGVSHSSIAVADGCIYLNGAIADNDALTNATVKITMPAISWTESEETYSYPAQTIEITGVSQTGSVQSRTEV